jgi:hypothetical protein
VAEADARSLLELVAADVARAAPLLSESVLLHEVREWALAVTSLAAEAGIERVATMDGELRKVEVGVSGVR